MAPLDTEATSGFASICLRHSVLPFLNRIVSITGISSDENRKTLNTSTFFKCPLFGGSVHKFLAVFIYFLVLKFNQLFQVTSNTSWVDFGYVVHTLYAIINNLLLINPFPPNINSLYNETYKIRKVVLKMIGFIIFLIFTIIGVLTLILSFKFKWYLDEIATLCLLFTSGITFGTYFLKINSELIKKDYSDYHYIIYIIYFTLLILFVFLFKNNNSKAMQQQWVFRGFLASVLTVCLMNVFSCLYVEFMDGYINLNIPNEDKNSFFSSRITYIGILLTLFVASYQLKDDTGVNESDSIKEKLDKIDKKIAKIEESNILERLTSIESNIKFLQDTCNTEISQKLDVVHTEVKLLKTKINETEKANSKNVLTSFTQNIIKKILSKKDLVNY